MTVTTKNKQIVLNKIKSLVEEDFSDPKDRKEIYDGLLDTLDEWKDECDEEIEELGNEDEEE